VAHGGPRLHLHRLDGPAQAVDVLYAGLQVGFIVGLFFIFKNRNVL